MNQPDISHIAALIGDSTRSKMLTALMNGQALTATELSIEAGVSASTTSSHLAKLVDQKLLHVRKQGRHKYFQLASREVAHLIEQLLNLSATRHLTVQTGPNDPALRQARVCYDHLAGTQGVILFDSLMEQGMIITENQRLELSAEGAQFFSTLGADIDSMKKAKRPICRHCLDWSERRDHLAGALGQWILDELLHKEWVRRDLTSRALHFSESGLRHFYHCFHLS